MKRGFAVLAILLSLTPAIRTLAAPAAPVTELRIDPLLLVSLEECRNIAGALGDALYPGWDFRKTPILFYRPGVQEILIDFPHRPAGFSEYTGFNPLGNETIYARNDTTTFAIDDQNTSTRIDGIPVLVVADPYSSMRSQIRSVLTERSRDFASKWLDDWTFIPSPYDELMMILHEGFHVYQDRRAENKGANELALAAYPLLDPVNNALYVLEGRILKDALLAPDSLVREEKIREFVSVRSLRQSRLDSAGVAYENLTEYGEGTAKYIEYKFLRAGEGIEPIPEMYYENGFHGYRGVLADEFRTRVNDMVAVVGVSDDRFGNRFGSGPLRFKLYELGACIAMLLDEVSPSWKATVFDDGVYLGDLLSRATPLTEPEKKRYVDRAKSEYGYEDAYRSKLQFEREGKEYVRNKLDGILKTRETLVRISYGRLTQSIGIAFTPFGVTQIAEKTSIYDLVPVKVQFKEGIELQMKQVIPVLIDRTNRVITFAVPTSASAMLESPPGRLETPEFSLSGAAMELKRSGTALDIMLK